jgi:ribosome-associated translation inhibitor RaiA
MNKLKLAVMTVMLMFTMFSVSGQNFLPKTKAVFVVEEAIAKLEQSQKQSNTSATIVAGTSTSSTAFKIRVGKILIKTLESAPSVGAAIDKALESVEVSTSRQATKQEAKEYFINLLKR